jgi:hypothetical protein
LNGNPIEDGWCMNSGSDLPARPCAASPAGNRGLERSKHLGIKSEADPVDSRPAYGSRQLSGETRYRIVLVDPRYQRPEFGGIHSSTDTKPPEEQP